MAARDQPVTVRCAAEGHHQVRWVKLAPAASAGDRDGGARWVEVSTRRRLILDAGLDARDGVYLCVLTDRSSPSAAAARLAGNVTIVSPCKYRHLTHTTLLPLD